MMKRRSVLRSVAGSLATAATARAENRRSPTDRGAYFELTEHEVTLSSLLAEHDGLRIAQLSDIHIGRDVPDERVIAAVDAVNAAAPDLIVLTGDYVTHHGDPIEHVPALLNRLRGTVVSVLGNHDHWTNPFQVSRELRSVGFHVLQNQHTTLRLRDKPFSIIGVDDAVSKHEDMHEAFRGVQATSSQLVLAHAPSSFDRLRSGAGLLCLSGHTHGGQWYIEGVSEALFARVGQPYVRGHHHSGSNQLYVNRGLGFGHHTRLPRVNSDPEVAILTLRSVQLQRSHSGTDRHPTTTPVVGDGQSP
jgi:uncharacterized protein